MHEGGKIVGVDDIPGHIAGLHLRLELGDFGRAVIQQFDAALVDELLERGDLAVLVDAAIGHEGQGLSFQRTIDDGTGWRCALRMDNRGRHGCQRCRADNLRKR